MEASSFIPEWPHPTALSKFMSQPPRPNQASYLKPHSLTASSLLVAVVLLAGCGGSGDPFSYVQEKGKITLTDGSMIPAPHITLIFLSQTPPADPKTYPPQGIAEVNVADGTYDSITSHKEKGVVQGKSKVIVRLLDDHDRPITGVIGVEYTDVSKTPLLADTAKPDSFNFTVTKYSGPAQVPGGRNYQGMGNPRPHAQGGVQSGQR